MCKILEISRSGYHHYLKNRYCQRKLENKALTELIHEIWEQSHKLYGYRRVHAELRSQGVYCNTKRVLRLMKNNNIAAKRKKKFKRTTNSNHSNYISPNLLNQNFRVKQSKRSLGFRYNLYQHLSRMALFSCSTRFIFQKSGWMVNE